MKIKDSELKAVLQEVKAELADLLKSEEQLAKAVEDKPEEKSPEASAPAPEASPEASAEASPPAEESAPPAPNAEMSAAPGEGEAPAPQGDMMDQGAGAEGAPEGNEIEATADPETLKAEYAKLTPDELKMHYMAAKAALFEIMGQEQAAPAPAPEAAPPAAPPAAEPAMKGEMKPEGNGGEVKALKKSEDAEKVEQLEKTLQERNQEVELMAKALDMVLKTPVRKAITNIQTVPEQKAMTPEEVKQKLKQVAGSPLKKSDRDLINKFCVGSIGQDKIEHLLK